MQFQIEFILYAVMFVSRTGLVGEEGSLCRHALHDPTPHYPEGRFRDCAPIKIHCHHMVLVLSVGGCWGIHNLSICSNLPLQNPCGKPTLQNLHLTFPSKRNVETRKRCRQELQQNQFVNKGGNHATLSMYEVEMS